MKGRRGVATSSADNNQASNIHALSLLTWKVASCCMPFLPIKLIAATTIEHYLLGSNPLVAYSLISSTFKVDEGKIDVFKQ